MCQRSGSPPIRTIGLGRYSVSSRMRVPKPPARITAFISLNNIGLAEYPSDEARSRGSLPDYWAHRVQMIMALRLASFKGP